MLIIRKARAYANMTKAISSMRYKIHIVTLPEEGLVGSYLIKLMCDIWRDDGHIVSIGPVNKFDADIGIVHIDRTWIPAEVLPENPHNRPLLNGNALDISKRTVSRLIIGQGADYDGPVIVKTNANHFGFKDQETGRLRTFICQQHQRLARVVSWQMARRLRPGQYPVLDRKEDVPGWVWRRDELIVEKFVPEIEGDHYVLRLWLFFGDREYGVKMWSKNPVVKSDGILRHEYIDDVPDEIREIRVKLGFDFGKFDYVKVNGKPMLIDANKTPWISTSSDRPSPNVLNLAEGIHSFIKTYGQ